MEGPSSKGTPYTQHAADHQSPGAASGRTAGMAQNPSLPLISCPGVVLPSSRSVFQKIKTPIHPPNAITYAYRRNADCRLQDRCS